MTKEQQPLISIIIPVFNVHKYLPDCLDSVICQSYKRIEIILVDDGSTDGSGVICDEYATTESRIYAYHIKNSGQGMARNFGVQKSKGDYIAFIDSDDVIHKKYIEILFKNLMKNNADISCCEMVRLYSKSALKKIHLSDICYVYSNTVALKNLFYRRKINFGPCNKLIKKCIVLQYPFPEHAGYEDMAVVYKWLSIAEQIVYSTDILYYYRHTPNSTMRMKFSPKKLDRMYIAEEMRSFIIGKYPQLSNAVNASYFMSNVQTLMWLPWSAKYKNQYRQISKNIRSVRRSVIENNEAKPFIRIMAITSFLGIIPFRFLGGIYRRVFSS